MRRTLGVLESSTPQLGDFRTGMLRAPLATAPLPPARLGWAGPAQLGPPREIGLELTAEARVPARSQTTTTPGLPSSAPAAPHTQRKKTSTALHFPHASLCPHFPSHTSGLPLLLSLSLGRRPLAASPGIPLSPQHPPRAVAMVMQRGRNAGRRRGPGAVGGASGPESWRSRPGGLCSVEPWRRVARGPDPLADPG